MEQNMQGNTEVVIDEKIIQDNRIPGKYNVVMLNDDVTPIEWVINILKSVFKHSDSNSQQITLKIHEEGSAVVGTYDYEIAEQKAIETTNLSRDQGFPLQIRIDENS
jgi:Uncharacterized conserved protein